MFVASGSFTNVSIALFARGTGLWAAKPRSSNEVGTPSASGGAMIDK